ncbi:MAG TPA: NRDE family protein [Kofleriaceae bacterium]|nr:NRDE family protein [Kofleriaceae bacterium]
MCTIAILIGVADAPVVIAANRDELYARITRPPEQLAAGIAGGVDGQSGGTWLAVNRAGRFVAVTNQRAMETPPPGLKSRGTIVRELAGVADPDAYVAAIDPRQYASMNLVWGDATTVRIAYLRQPTGAHEVETLPRGIHVLCNDRLGAPGFPRSVRLEQAITKALEHSRAWPQLWPTLARALADHSRVAIEDVPPSHLPPELARELTATCIHSELYGTRSASLVAVEPGRIAAYLHADGPPCTTTFADRMELLA